MIYKVIDARFYEKACKLKNSRYINFIKERFANWKHGSICEFLEEMKTLIESTTNTLTAEQN